jgi:hypothetical protein
MTTFVPSGQTSNDQARKLILADSLYRLAEQKQSKLASAGIATFVPSEGLIYNFTRTGKTELVEVGDRNPLKQYENTAFDNRQFSKRRFTRTFLLDEKQDIDELIVDPTSEIVSGLNYAANRVQDKIGVGGVLGSVLVGMPGGQTTSRTAAQDGVKTIDATGGLTYDRIQEITRNFQNSDLDISDYQNAVIAVTGKEQVNLMGEDKFINSRFINGRPVEDGYQSGVGMYRLANFAGSVNGVNVYQNPILPEVSGVRNCFVACPNSILMMMEIARLDITKSDPHVNSWSVTIDMWIGAMRKEGILVQQINTTI